MTSLVIHTVEYPYMILEKKGLWLPQLPLITGDLDSFCVLSYPRLIAQSSGDPSGTHPDLKTTYFYPFPQTSPLHPTLSLDKG